MASNNESVQAALATDLAPYPGESAVPVGVGCHSLSLAEHLVLASAPQQHGWHSAPDAVTSSSRAGHGPLLPGI